MLPNPYAILGGLLAVIALCVASFGFGHHVDHQAFVAYRETQAAEAEKQVAANRTALLDQQQADQAVMAKINQSRGDQINEITQRRDALLTANRDLSQRLYVAISSSGSAKPAVPTAGTRGPVDDGGSQAEIPTTIAPWLIDQFTQADSDAALVGALQQVVAHDRAVCNGSLPGIVAAQ